MRSRWFVLGALVGLGLLAPALSACEAKAEHGERCIRVDDCRSDLVCVDLACRTPGEATLLEALREEKRKKEWQARKLAALQKEKKLSDDSGVDLAQQAERAHVPAVGAEALAGGLRIRISKTEGDAPIFAACRVDEQLISGGCQALDLEAAISQSYPSNFGGQGLRGARWNCSAVSKYVKKPMAAFALCLSLGDAGASKPEGR